MSASASDSPASHRPFFLVGPTAVGKSAIGAALAAQCGGEVIGADAFQIYRGIPILTASPPARLLEMAPHHLAGFLPIEEAFNAARYAELARNCIADIIARGGLPLVVGGTGLYIRALTHGLSKLPPADPALRAELQQKGLPELQEQLRSLDPEGAALIDTKNPRRIIRAIEISILSGRPFSRQREHSAAMHPGSQGVFLIRDRDDLRSRISRRVEEMFANGVVEEVKRMRHAGPTARQVLGWSQIGDHLDGRMTLPGCMESIRNATWQYARRQLTWFKRQTIFEPLNLSLYDNQDSLLKELARKVRSFSAPIDV